MSKNKKSKFFYGYIIVLVGFIISSLVLGGINSFGVFLKPVLTEFGWTRAMASGAFSVCTLLIGFLGIGAGRLNDRFGPRLLLTVGGFLAGTGYLLMSQVSAIWQIYLYFGVLVGFG